MLRIFVPRSRYHVTALLTLLHAHALRKSAVFKAAPPIGQSIIDPFSVNSQTQGSAVVNIGLTQDLNEFGLRVTLGIGTLGIGTLGIGTLGIVTLGIGFVTTSGLGVDFRDVPESNGSNASLAIFSLPMSLGVVALNGTSAGHQNDHQKNRYESVYHAIDVRHIGNALAASNLEAAIEDSVVV